MIPREDITGLVLAGGQGSRMGGADKGLQLLHGRPLARHALERLAPQVGPLLVNANRHLEAYAAFGAPVVADEEAGFPGPLAGFVAGLAACRTPWLVTVPCDTPGFPADLVARLAAAAVGQGRAVAIAHTVEDGVEQAQPVFCLLRVSLLADLRRYLATGRRRIEPWTAEHGRADVVFGDAAAFFNANTPEELEQAARRAP